jgi:hypothetical protein
VWVQPAARILHLEGLSHSRRTDQGLKQHQVRNLEQLKERWQHTLDTEQPPEGMTWLLARIGGCWAGHWRCCCSPVPRPTTAAGSRVMGC